MPLRITDLSDKGQIAALNRWADLIETKLRGINTDTSYVNAIGEKSFSTAANANSAATSAQSTANAANTAATNAKLYAIAAASARPDSNPLTAHDAGSNVTVTIASFNMHVAGIGAIAITGNTLTGLSYGTVYYIYYTDPNLTGGAVTFQTSLTKHGTIGSTVNFYVGSILTPVSGGADTIGNNDGGAGAQTGVQANCFSSVVTVVNSGGTATIVNQGRMVDGNLNDFGEIQLSGTMSGDVILSGISGIAPAYSSLVLNVKTAIPSNGGALLTLAYSLDGGSTWTNIYSVGTTRAITTDSITLSPSQNIGAVQLRFTWSSSVGAHWDIYGGYIAASA